MVAIANLEHHHHICVENNGKKRWKKVEVKLEDHVNIPIFPPSLCPDAYDKYLDDYMSKLAVERLSPEKPLWEFHIFKYPTSNAAGNVIIKLHHALGDGFSLMSALLSCLQRADDPRLPLTFPSRQRSQPKSESLVTKVCSSVFNTLSDFWWGISNSTMDEDDLTPIRSGKGIEFQPIAVSTMTFSLDQIKLIKSKLGVTINDVLTGMIFLGTRLYMQRIDKSSRKARGTAVVLHNTRMMGDYTSIQEIIKPNSKMPWGNHITFLHAQKIISMKRNSLAIYLTSRFLEILNRFGGHEAAAKYIRSTLQNSSMVISNMIGPVEQMALGNHPIKGLYFLVLGSPEGLDVTIVSYMGKVKIAFKMEKGLIDPQKFKSCMENAFEMILKASDTKNN
ncbi:unnamed protein product [Prunus armeniaca]|uniref:Uncharacterized protein n=1 Tax=Prunus armeniaca TaxID=36596 RepID=A0A6J5VQR9_PRUAR|nr:unnamed protein product [Prunus armeniaca]